MVIEYNRLVYFNVLHMQVNSRACTTIRCGHQRIVCPVGAPDFASINNMLIASKTKTVAQQKQLPLMFRIL